MKQLIFHCRAVDKTEYEQVINQAKRDRISITNWLRLAIHAKLAASANGAAAVAKPKKRSKRKGLNR